MEATRYIQDIYVGKPILADSGQSVCSAALAITAGRSVCMRVSLGSTPPDLQTLHSPYGRSKPLLKSERG